MSNLEKTGQVIIDHLIIDQLDRFTVCHVF